MQVRIALNGREETVSVEPVAGDPTRLRVGRYGVAEVVDCVRVGDGRYSLLRLGTGHASLDLTVAETGVPGELTVQIGHAVFCVAVDGCRAREAARPRSARAGKQRVVAPMPGRVLQLLVGPGDEVEAGQGLVVVEAMKMENEIGAPRAGRVERIEVEVGASVEAGRLLVVVA